ncbi:putative membrane protein [Escherichia coli]|nr:putative membrane protein [Escherichia coli]
MNTCVYKKNITCTLFLKIYTIYKLIMNFIKIIVTIFYKPIFV